jgi:hypothetical protein
VAYDGYSANIEAFLCATARKERLYCDLPHYPITGYTSITVPIALPRTIFTFKSKPSADAVKKMMKAAEKMGIEEIQLGKGTFYTIEKPSIEFLAKISPGCPPACSNLEDYSQLGSTMQFYILVQIADLFLSTNTYSYRPVNNASLDNDTLDSNVALDYSGVASWAGGCTKDIAVKVRNTTGSWDDRAIACKPDTDNFYDSRVRPSHCVFVAKPSPLPSKTSWGSPAECPNKAGIHFPYFEGMNHSDTKYMRQIVHKRFFRNLGSPAKDPRTAFKEFRSEIGSAATTSQGRVMNHLLTGFDLALQTQTQCFALFEGSKYLGFNLLGEHFSVWLDSWHNPSTAAELKAVMDKYKSHAATLTDLAQLFRNEAVSYRLGYSFGKRTLSTSQDVVDVLGQIEVDDTGEDVLIKVETAMKNLVFEGEYRTLSPSAINEAIKELLNETSLNKDSLVYVPMMRKFWNFCGIPSYKVFASFGSRGFSLIDRSGKATEISLDTTHFKKHIEANEKGNSGVRDCIPFFEKPISECTADWAKVVETGRARINFAERAIGCRGYLMRGDGLVEVIATFEQARDGRKIGQGSAEAKGKGREKGKGRADDVEMDTFSLADMF